MEVDYEEAMRLLEDEIKELNHKLKVAQQTKVCTLYQYINLLIVPVQECYKGLIFS